MIKIKNAQNELADIERVVDKADGSLDNQGTPVQTHPKTPEEVLKHLTPEQKEIAKNNQVSQSWIRIQDSIKKMPHGSKVIGFLNGMPEYQSLATKYKNLTLNQTQDKKIDGKTTDELANMGFSTLLTDDLKSQESSILNRAKSIQKKLEQQELLNKQKQQQQYRTSFNLNNIKTSQIQPYLEDLDSKSSFVKKYLPLLLSGNINSFNTARNEILSSVGLGTAMVDEVRAQLEEIQQLPPERIQEAEELLSNIYTNWISPSNKKDLAQEGLVMSSNNPKGIIKYDLSDKVLNNNPLYKDASANVGAESLLYGPTEKRICPKLRGKGGGPSGSNDVVSEYTCRHHCLDGIVIDDNKTVCGEALWRANVMDKFSREYVNENGDIVGGYLNKRFEINRNVPEENKMRLKPGETRKPRPPEMGNMESRMQAMREKEGEKRGYRPTTDTSKPFNWCKDVDQNNINVSQSEKNKREENSGHDLVNYTEKKAFNIKNLKTSQMTGTNGPVGVDNPASDDLGLSSDYEYNQNKEQGHIFEVGLNPGEYQKFTSDPKIEQVILDEIAKNLYPGFSIASIDDSAIVFKFSGQHQPSPNTESVLEEIVDNIFNANQVKAMPISAFNMKNIKTAQGDNIPGTDNGRKELNIHESPIRDDGFDNDTPPCPICDGDGQLLGVLGHTKHYRCRNCGMEFNNSNDKMAKKKSFSYKGHKYKTNPFAVCNKTVGKKEDPEKYEKCVKEVKQDSKIASTTIPQKKN